MAKKKTQQLLPWSTDQLRTLLEDLIAHGTETSKVDFKTEIEASTAEQKAELLKDITAIANTYDDENYENYGFLLYGVQPRNIVGITTTEPNTDSLQNHIEQLLKTYISPMPQIYVMGFTGAAGEKWGAIVIPPRNAKPYMFFKDVSCKDPAKTKRKGEWFVRRGATTDHGLPEDLVAITQRQTEASLEPLRESIRSLQSRVAKTEEQYNGALFKLVERIANASPSTTPKEDGLETEIGAALGVDLAARLKQKLRTPKDILSEDLVAEAKMLQEFLAGSNTGLSWVPQPNNVDENREMIEGIEEKTRTLQISIATILLNDHNGQYTRALIRAVKVLAKTVEIPAGIQYNRIGEALRYYPLGLILYTIFICGVAADRSSVLKEVLQIPLKHRRNNTTSPITGIFFLWYNAKALFNDIIGQGSAYPIGQRVRQVTNDTIGEMLTEFTEPEWFFRGEFVLALTYIDDGIKKGESPEYIRPLPGVYLYSRDAAEAITGFLLERPEWFDSFYINSPADIFTHFDEKAHNMSESGYFTMGLHGLKAAEIYQRSLAKRPKK